MKFTDNKYSLNLIDNEEVLYVPNKDKEEFWVNIIYYTSFCLFFMWLGFKAPQYIIPEAVITTELVILLICSVFLGQVYTYIRDYGFSQVILTDKRLIIVRFNKIISVDYSEIKKIYYREFGYHPTFFLIELISNKVYKVNFVPRYKFKEKFEEINQEIKCKNEIFMSSEILNQLYLKFQKTQQNSMKPGCIEENLDCWMIKPKRKYILKSSFLLLFFTILFYLIFITSHSYVYKIFFGFMVFCIFGPVSILILIKLMSLKPTLIVKTEGVYYQGIFISWANINDFSIMSTSNNYNTLIMKINNFDKIIKQFNPIKRIIVALNKKTMGGVLPISLFGTNLSQIEVLKKMHDCLERARSL